GERRGDARLGLRVSIPTPTRPTPASRAARCTFPPGRKAIGDAGCRLPFSPTGARMPEPDAAAWLALTAIAVCTSIVSGVMGLAGGMLLLAALLHWLDPLVAIPVHGIVQLVSNASRAWLQRTHVRWDAVWRFAWPLLPAGAAGLWLLRAIPPDGGRLAIGAFVLLATWAPRLL